MGLDISESLQEQSQAAQESQDECTCEVWPDHWDALNLFLACREQMEISLGDARGVYHMAARSVNVHQELTWLGIKPKMQAKTVALFRQIEVQAINLLNQQATKKTS